MSTALKLLILEDNPADADLVVITLKRSELAFTARIASDKTEFADALHSFEPDLILSDHRLPQFSSSQALVSAREKFPFIPFILVTGTVSDEFAASIIKDGADDYLLKNNLKRLPVAIRQAIERKQTEKARALLVSIVDSSEDAIISKTLDGIITSWNNGAEKLFGYTAGEVIGKNISILIPRDRLEEEPAIVDKIKRGKFIEHYETVRKRKDGEMIQISLTVSPITDAHGHITGASKIARDITHRKEAEQKLIQSQANLKAIFDNASEIFILTDAKGHIKAFNNNTSKMVLLASREPIAIGKSMFDLVEPLRKKSFKQAFSRILSGESIEYDRAYTMQDGRLTWISYSLNPVRQQNSITGICITGTDITERKKAEDDIKKSYLENQAMAERMSAILNTLPANIALLNNKGFIIEVNEAWRRLAEHNSFIGSAAGIGDNYIIASKKSAGKDAGDGKAVAHGIESVLKNKVEEFIFEYSCNGPLPIRWFRMVVTPLEDKDSGGGVVVMHIDISALHKLEQERLEATMTEQKNINRAMLQAQEQERNQLGRELHDNISQLLAAIKMKLRFCLAHYDRGIQTVTECVDHVDEAMNEARNLSHRMVIPRFADTLFETALNDLTSNYGNQSRKIRLLFDRSAEQIIPPPIKESLYRIVQEQMNNIEKYAAASGVSIQVNLKEGAAYLTVVDNGVGFDMKKKRTGIGLTNILNRAEAYGGSAKIISAPGKGCRLQVIIPVDIKNKE